jgi:hypothetical protein
VSVSIVPVYDFNLFMHMNYNNAPFEMVNYNLPLRIE